MTIATPVPLVLPMNLNTPAQKMLETVPAIADELNHNYVGDEHILIGLVRQIGETPQTIFTRYFMRSSEQVLDAVIHVSGKPQRGNRPFDPLPERKRTPDYEAVLMEAAAVAKERGLTEIGLVDILIAITRFWHSRAYTALENMRIEPRELARRAMGMK